MAGPAPIRHSAADWTPRSPVEGNPVWFGAEERPLCGWLHTPADGTARGGVVLCPPLGIEAICAYFTYRKVAVRLAEAGLAVLRFDYDGTGDSFGDSTEPNRVASWTDSVGSAIDTLEQIGVDRVALLGMRVGALLAALAAARRERIDALVLWDPCLTGSSFVREQQALHLLSGGGGDGAGGGVEIPGLVLSEETVEDLRRLRLDQIDVGAVPHVLVLPDPDRPAPSRLAEHLQGSSTEWIDAVGQSDLMDPPRQETPVQTIGAVTDWLSGRFAAAEGQPLAAVPTRSSVGVGAGDNPVAEHFVKLGPAGLFGILTEAVRPRADAPTLVFVNEGNTPHIGQSRMWVEMSRRWAGAGLRALRWDLSGNGDSLARPGCAAHVDRAPEAFADVADAVQDVSDGRPSEVVLVGLCSGGYQAVESALRLKPRGVCLLNPIFTFVPPEPSVDERRMAREAPRAWTLAVARGPVRWLAKRRSPLAVQRWTTALEDATWVTALSRRYPRTPGWLWEAVKNLCVENLAARSVERLAVSGVDVYLLCGERDYTRFELGSRRTLRRLAALDNFHLEVVPGLDHAALAADHRGRLMEILTDHVITAFSPSAGPGPT